MAEGDVQCSRCGRRFEKEEFVASISGSIMGDECTDCYHWCGTCGVYTVRLHRDAFTGVETAHDSEPISKEEGDRRLNLIRSCGQRHEKRCRCDGHRADFGEWLD